MHDNLRSTSSSSSKSNTESSATSNGKRRPSDVVAAATSSSSSRLLMPPIMMMSDDESDPNNGGNDHYSAEYHAKVAAKRQRTAIMDDAYDEQSRFPTSIGITPPRNRKPSTSGSSNLQIVSVCTLPQGAAMFGSDDAQNEDDDDENEEDDDGQQPAEEDGGMDDDTNSSSAVADLRNILATTTTRGDASKTANNMRRPMFGIAQTATLSPRKQKTTSRNKKDDNDDDDDGGSLLVAMEPANKKVRRPKNPTTKKSKLRSLRTAFDKQFRSQMNSKSANRAQPVAAAAAVPTSVAKSSRVPAPQLHNEKSSSRSSSAHDEEDSRSDHVTITSDDGPTANINSAQNASKQLTTDRSSTSGQGASVLVGIAERIKGSSRRKTTHKPLLAEDEMDIEFVETPRRTKNAEKPVISSAPPPLMSSTSNQNLLAPLDKWIGEQPPTLRAQLELVRSIPNPNANLMEKLAFLRVCINYMLRELGRPEIKFARRMTIEKLRQQYK